jgi:two-component system NtrC family response regulator
MELPDNGLSLEDVERELLIAALVKHDWNQTKAATYLNISRSALIYRMQKFALERPAPSTDAE